MTFQNLYVPNDINNRQREPATGKQIDRETSAEKDSKAYLGWRVHKVHFRVISVFFIREIEREDIVDGQLV